MTTIQVTRTLINHGERASCGLCPVALGIARHVVKDCEVHVIDDRVTFMPMGGRDPWRKLPREVIRWICAFDAEMPCEPIAFRLNIPAHLLRSVR